MAGGGVGRISTPLVVLALGTALSVMNTGTVRSAEAAPPDTLETVDEQNLPDLLWNRIDLVLSNRVHDGLVEYEGLNGDGPFHEAYATLMSVTWDELDSWNRDDQLAFWINAYNICTLKLIADHYPIRARFPRSLVLPDNSILMIPGRWKEITFPIAGADRTLDEIEHRILRVRFEEPRIHFAIVCASIGCPLLRAEAFRGAYLDHQLEEQARRYFARPTGLTVDLNDVSPSLKLTKIFDWFGEDFVDLPTDSTVLAIQTDDRRTLLAVAARWFPPEVQELLRQRPVRTGWLDYDWELNEWVPPEPDEGRP